MNYAKMILFLAQNDDYVVLVDLLTKLPPVTVKYSSSSLLWTLSY